MRSTVHARRFVLPLSFLFFLLATVSQADTTTGAPQALPEGKATGSWSRVVQNITPCFSPGSSASDGDCLMIGGETVFSAQKGDCLSSIGARFGIDWRLVARKNGFDPRKMCPTGQKFMINNLRIVPKTMPDGIVVNIPDRMLYYFRDGRLLGAFPVGLGLPAKEWQTPVGPFLIVGKESNPTWFVPKSIQAEMIKKGQPLQTVVPPGPENPLGRYALHTSFPGVLIHETIWPTTVYQWRSHGCIRVSPEDMDWFFSEVERGAKGERPPGR
jgi:L,D-transpeptidase ErfK/SrfK